MSDVKDSSDRLADVQASYQANVPDIKPVRELYRLSRVRHAPPTFDRTDHFVIGMNAWDAIWLRRIGINAWDIDDCRAVKSDWEAVGQDLARALTVALANRSQSDQMRFWKELLKGSHKRVNEIEVSDQLELPMEAPASHD